MTATNNHHLGSGETSQKRDGLACSCLSLDHVAAPGGWREWEGRNGFLANLAAGAITYQIHAAGQLGSSSMS